MEKLLNKQYQFYEKTGILSAWAQNFKGSGLNVAIIDSGISESDYFPNSRLIDYVNLTEETKFDTHGHGSHIAGLIIGEHIQAKTVGVLPEAHFLIIKVITSKGRTSVDKLIESLHFIKEYNINNPQKKIHLVNISLGNKKYSDELYRATLDVYDQGTVIVASSGNFGDGDDDTMEINFPGVFCEAIQIGAVSHDFKVLNFSNSNINLDFVSLGENVMSNSNKDDRFIPLSGTSMATALSTGVIGLYINMLNTGGKMSPTEVYEIVKNKCIALPHDRRGVGNGVVNFKN